MRPMDVNQPGFVLPVMTTKHRSDSVERDATLLAPSNMLENENSMPKSVLAVVVSFNDGAALIKTVNALVSQVDKVVIVDNGSSPETLYCIAELETTLGITPIYLHENIGIGGALNIGVSIARKEHFDWILTMDQDSVAAPQMVSEMFMSAETCQDAAVICPLLVADGVEKVNKDKAVTSAITSGNLVKVSCLQFVGDYNERYFIDSVDFEFSLRIRNAGYKIVKCGSANLHHRLGETRVVSMMEYKYHYILHSPLRRYYMYRNHMYLVSGFWSRNPVFLMKKTIIAIYGIVEITIFDPQRWANLKMMGRGVADFFRARDGRYAN